MTKQLWDAVIIGGGPAGLSAAQALGRSLRRVLVIDEGIPRNRFASHMHNVVGLDGMHPAELNQRGRAEAERYGVQFCAGAVKGVSEGETGLRIELGDGEIAARSLVVATGVTDVLPEIPGLAERWGSTVLHCPYCHGWEVRGKRLAVIPHPEHGVHQTKLVRQLSEHLVLFTEGLTTLDEDTTIALQSRGIRLVSDPVAEVLGQSNQVTAVRTRNGREIPVDAIFTLGALVPNDDFLAELALDRADGPMGSFIATDATGRTSNPRVWAVGNVVRPGTSVPVVVAEGHNAGASVNMMLVEEDFARAVHETHVGYARGVHTNPDPTDSNVEATRLDPAEFWEQRYAGQERVWSGRVNRTLSDIVAGWRPGRSLDLGCGEGGDVLWLAENGWQAQGIDLSQTAVARARAEAQARGLGEDQAAFVARDLAVWAGADPAPDDRYDLITASFLQSPVELPRARVLRAAADRVAPGGHLVVVSHAEGPPWAAGLRAQHQHSHAEFPSPDSELAALAFDPKRWQVEVAEVREREATGPDGTVAMLRDTVVVARRLAE